MSVLLWRCKFVMSEECVSATPASIASKRQQLFGIFDRLVTYYNETDLESMMSVLLTACCKNVAVKSSLASPVGTNNRVTFSVLLHDTHDIPYFDQDSSIVSIALVWMLLCSTHPDGVMKLIDRRICPCNPVNRPNLFQSPMESPDNQSVLEVVVSLCGTCTTEQSLHGLLSSMASELHSIGHSSVTPLSASARMSANACTIPTLGTAATTETTARSIDASTALEAMSSLLARHLGTDRDPDTYQGQRRRYLIEFRLQFDEHDLVTHWTTTVLAAEPEEVFRR